MIVKDTSVHRLNEFGEKELWMIDINHHDEWIEFENADFELFQIENWIIIDWWVEKWMEFD